MSAWMDVVKRMMGHVGDATLIELALDGLDREARARAEAHLRHCALCRRALRDWMELHDGLASLVPPQTAPAGLEVRIVSRINQEGRA